MASSNIHEKTHPGPRQYITIAVILVLMTAIEVGVFYLTITPAAMTGIVLLLALGKFSLVVGYYMQLRFDDRRFLYLFTVGFVLALAIMIALMALFGSLTR
jgi:heme/copper-type cytochrome/quinol oxidase subunit 4